VGLGKEEKKKKWKERERINTPRTQVWRNKGGKSQQGFDEALLFFLD
jgi:hypothetical protein